MEAKSKGRRMKGNEGRKGEKDVRSDGRRNEEKRM